MNFDNPTLYELKEQFRLSPSQQTYTDFITKFVDYVRVGKWVYIPCNGEGDSKTYQFIVKDFCGGKYVAIYSGEEGRAAGDSKNIICTDVRKIISAMYDNPRLSGIVFDPNKNSYFLNRKDISHLTDLKDPRIQIKDWGDGVPAYTQKDLMVPEELLDFAMEIAENNYLNENGYQILERNIGIGSFPNFAMKYRGNLVFAKVDYSITNIESIPTEEEQIFYREHAAKFNAKCLYIPVIIQAKDPIRAAQGIQLYGDCYECHIGTISYLN